MKKQNDGSINTGAFEIWACHSLPVARAAVRRSHLTTPSRPKPASSAATTASAISVSKPLLNLKGVSEAMLAIQQLLDDTVWESCTLEHVDEILIRARVRDPHGLGGED